MLAISVCIPTTGLSRAEHTMSLVNMALTYMREPIFEGEQQSIVFRHYQSSSISNGRESLAMQWYRLGRQLFLRTFSV